MQVYITTTQKYLNDLLIFLTDNLDDGWGKPFSCFSEREKQEVISDFQERAATLLTEGTTHQEIRSKYLKRGSTRRYLDFTPDHFEFTIQNPFTEEQQMITLKEVK